MSSEASTITLELHTGAQSFASEQDVYDAIGKIVTRVQSCNYETALATFALGEMIVKLVDAIEASGRGRTSVRNAAIEARVHHQTANRAVNFYQRFRDEETTGFSREKWKDAQLKVADAVRTGDVSVKTDSNGEASVTAVQRVTGMRSLQAKRVPLGPKPGSAFSAALASCADQVVKKAVESGPRRANPSRRSGALSKPVVTTGEQLELDFDLARDGAELAAAAERVEKLLRADEISKAEAERLHGRMREVIDELERLAKQGAAA